MKRRDKILEDEESKVEEGSKRKKKFVLEDKGGNVMQEPQRVKFSKVIDFYRETDTRDVLRKSDMFQGMEFYIVNVDDQIANKPYLESRIVEHGGKRVQNLLPTTTHIIAA